VAAPEIYTKVIDGVVNEPYERVNLEFPQRLTTAVVSLLAQLMAETNEIKEVANNRVLLEAVMPVRLMMNLPRHFNTLTQGEGVLTHSFESYRPKAEVESERGPGALVAVEGGEVNHYSLTQLANSGTFFVSHGDVVYYGQIVGQNGNAIQGQDLAVNVTKKNEAIGGFRANAVDAAKKTKVVAAQLPMNLESSIAWINVGESVCITPKTVRIRKPTFNGKTQMRGRK